uniref:glucan endo-1,3-beta-D-glucosidase n=1 Tax=Fagus sylvatica TaxID=28930 RepID=A0A2N9IRK6_FAGSY
MASCYIFKALLMFLTLSDSFVQNLSIGVGINYGQIADNLPSPSRVAYLLTSLNISREMSNEYLQNMTDPLKAQAWIEQHVLPHLPQTKISCILVGNEVFYSNDTQLKSNLLPAMQMVYRTLVNLGLDKQVTVTTAHSLTILGTSFPPSAGTFRQDLAQYIQPLLNFHAQIDSPFLINAYPYFAYKDNPGQIQLEYVLFQPNQGMVDPNTNLHYDNMLYAQIDAVYAAMKAMGHTDVEVKISETGWPSKGDNDEAGATPQNAGIYNGNLLQKIQEKQGTPAKPSTPVDIYVFALFNENLKPGPASERELWPLLS